MENGAPKKRGPGRPRKTENEQRLASYKIYQERSDGTIKLIGESAGRNAAVATTDFLRENKKLATEDTFFVVPVRNISRIKVAVETEEKLSVTSL